MERSRPGRHDGVSCATVLVRTGLAGLVFTGIMIALNQSNNDKKNDENTEKRPADTVGAQGDQTYPLPEGVEARKGFSPLTGQDDKTAYRLEPTSRPMDLLPAPTAVVGEYGPGVVVDPIYYDEPYDCSMGPCIKIQTGGRVKIYGLEGQRGPVPQNYVSEEDNIVTDFDAIKLGPDKKYLGAHNTKAGRWFEDIVPGDQAVILEKGQKRCYEGVTMNSYQMAWVHDTRNPAGPMIDLKNGVEYSPSQVLDILINSGYKLVLQTCITNNGDDFWGRLFVFYKEVDCSETKIDLVYLFVSKEGVMTLVRKGRKQEERRRRHKRQH